MKKQTSNCAPNRLARTFPDITSMHATAPRKKVWTLAACLIGVAILAGCASTKVTNNERLAYGKLPRPDHILIYDFGASASDIAADSSLTGQASPPTAPPTSEQQALGRELGSSIATQLTAAVREMGMPAVQVSRGTAAQLNDIVIRGYLVSVEKGSTAKRMTIGFGSGGSELTTFVEGYQMTANGLRKLGSGTTGSKGSKGPGAGVGAATWLITGSPVGLIASGGMKIYGEASGSATIEGRAKATAKEIADVLKTRFKEQGWIN
jgi:uncharacterized protein DUF4410